MKKRRCKRKQSKKGNNGESVIYQLEDSLNHIKKNTILELEKLGREQEECRAAIRTYDRKQEYHLLNLSLQRYQEVIGKINEILSGCHIKQFLHQIYPVIEKCEDESTATPTLVGKKRKRDFVVNVDEPWVSAALQKNQQILALQGVTPKPSEIATISKPIIRDICPNAACQGQPLFLIPKESRFVCQRCGEGRKTVGSLTNTLHFGGDEQEVAKQTAYERKKNYKNFLTQFSETGKQVPPECIDYLNACFHNQLARSRSEVRSTPIKEHLKKHLEFRKYTDCAAKIANILNGRPVPCFTEQQINTFLDLFDSLQFPFHSTPHTFRINFLNSLFITNKFCGLTGLSHYQEAFPLLKNRRTLQAHCSSWKIICEANGYFYERSI